MSENGILIEQNEFMSLSQKKQMAVLYQNTEEIKKKVNGWVVKQRIMYAWLASISAIGIWLIRSITKL